MEPDRVMHLARDLGFLRVKDLLERELHPETLRRLCRRGLLERMGRGLYRLSGAEVSAHITLAAVAKRIPHAVVCLLSALRFHGLGTQNPPDVWIALRNRAASPRGKDLPLRVVRFSDTAFASGTEEHVIEGVHVRVTCPAKTVVDCFKFRNKTGLDVALEALREGLRTRKCAMDDLWKYARICRVANVMRPYLEAIG